jgi:hypothetical protein
MLARVFMRPLLISNTVFPDAESLFKFQLAPLNEIKDRCFIVIDTNALLVPYTVNQKSLQEIRSTYQRLIALKRLVIPGQVAREFARNRALKISELYQQLSRKRDAQGLSRLEQYPLLQSMPEFKEATELSEKIETITKEYRHKISDVLSRVKEWVWNDPVSLIYRDLFTADVILDIPVCNENKHEIEADLETRITHSIPPGYKDAAKPDRGLGDLLIWRTILEVGRKNKSDLLFVSGDEKTDWWYQSEKLHLYPRYELVDEYRRASDEKSSHIVAFSRFLELFGASEDVVNEVRKEEFQSNRNAQDVPSWVGMQARFAVSQWLVTHFKDFEVSPDPSGIFDYQVYEPGGASVGVEIKFFRDAHKSIRRYHELFASLERKVDTSQTLDNFILILVGESVAAGHSLSVSLSKIGTFLQNREVYCGFINSSNEFVEVPNPQSRPYDEIT